MGLEFRVGPADHLVVEDFVTSRPEGVDGIIIDAHYIDRHEPAIEAARIAGIGIAIEPLTERLAEPGFSPEGLTYAAAVPTDVEGLLGSSDAVNSLVERVIERQVDVATVLVPPHFYADRHERVEVNARLAEAAIKRYGSFAPVRAVLCVSRSFLAESNHASRVARRLRDAGVSMVDLRLSPLGADKDGSLKIRTAFEILRRFSAEGVRAFLGFQGTVGPTALALGLVDGFSVGVGYREHYDFPGTIGQQRRLSESDGGPRGAQAGVYLPGAAATVPRGTAATLYRNPSIRTKIVCPLGTCSAAIDQPVRDPRPHYLHSKAEVVSQMRRRPPTWRPKLERNRIERAIELREIINAHHLPSGSAPLKTRLLEALSAEIEDRLSDAGSPPGMTS